MMVENETRMDERDIDQDIQEKKELIEKVESLKEEADWNVVSKQISDLKRKWKRLTYWESVYEDELLEQFEAAIDELYAKRNEIYQSAKELKKELVSKAQHLSTSANLNQVSEEMNELMRQWKVAGFAGDEDDALWNAFNEARQTFYDKKHKHWEEMQSKFENSRKVKEELIEEVRGLVDSTDWKKTSDKMNELMEKWKACGRASNEYNDALWNEFNGLRQQFYDRRNAYYDDLHEKQQSFYEKKKALIQQVQAIVDEQAFTKENTAMMKQLSQDWKEIGRCGKALEDEVWAEFRSVMDAYFAGLKEMNEQKHLQWRQRMMENRKRKMDLITNQKRQLKRMQDELVGLLSQREYDYMLEEIEDKKEFIVELEKQLEEIDQLLSK